MLQPETQPTRSSRRLHLVKPAGMNETRPVRIEGFKVTLPLLGLAIEQTFGPMHDQPNPVRSIRRIGVTTPEVTITERLNNPHLLQDARTTVERLKSIQHKLGRKEYPFPLLLSDVLVVETLPTNMLPSCEEDEAYLAVAHGLQKIAHKHDADRVYSPLGSTVAERDLLAQNAVRILSGFETSL